ncbi:hypothetical protein AAVH_09237 [Aphelenchoides avenae]|nr:hypothetical protein AAVH_09237 [Aphelenchus avenae]
MVSQAMGHRRLWSHPVLPLWWSRKVIIIIMGITTTSLIANRTTSITTMATIMGTIMIITITDTMVTDTITVGTITTTITTTARMRPFRAAVPYYDGNPMINDECAMEMFVKNKNVTTQL